MVNPGGGGGGWGGGGGGLEGITLLNIFTRSIDLSKVFNLVLCVDLV